MKAAERKTLINMLIADENLTTAHLKTMLYFMNNEKNVTSNDISEILKCKPQYTSKILNELKEHGYIKITSKIKSTRILLYELETENKKSEKVSNKLNI